MWIFSPRRCSRISTRAVLAPRSKPSSSTVKPTGRSPESPTPPFPRPRARPPPAPRRPGAEVEALVIDREADREIHRVPDLALHAVEDQFLALPHPVLFSAALHNRKHLPLLGLFKGSNRLYDATVYPPGTPTTRRDLHLRGLRGRGERAHGAALQQAQGKA